MVDLREYKRKAKFIASKNDTIFKISKFAYHILLKVKSRLKVRRNLRLIKEYFFSIISVLKRIKYKVKNSFYDKDFIKLNESPFKFCDPHTQISKKTHHEILDYYEKNKYRSREHTFRKYGKKIRFRAKDISSENIDILVFPDYRLNNPYQKDLYLFNETTKYINTVDALKNFLEKRGSEKKVLHLHWTSNILRELGFERFKKSLDLFLSRGGKVVWFVHNLYPHDSQDKSEEKKLRLYISEISSKVVVLAEASKNKVIDEFHCDPSKMTVIPHPNYARHYNYPDLDFSVRGKQNSGRTKLLIMGSIKKYKGIKEFLDAFVSSEVMSKLCSLTIVGNADDETYRRELMNYGDAFNVHFDLRMLSDYDLASYLNECDFVVQNYLCTLNSGVTLLALSKNRPVLCLKNDSFDFLIENGENGFKYGNFSELESEMASLVKNKEKLKQKSFKSVEMYDCVPLSQLRDTLKL